MRPKNDERKMDVYHFVTSFMKERGVCPTTLEIGNTLGMAKSTVSKYMNRLVEEGLIEKYGRYQTITADNFSYTRMPIVGAIACGAPTLAIEDIEGYLPVDEASLGPGEYFGLIASGDSMIKVGIDNGDTVYVRKQDTADDGDIVIAIVNQNDAVCKRLKKYKGGIALVSNNPMYEPMYFTITDTQDIPVRIIGKVVELRGKL